MSEAAWDPDAYGRFQSHRLQPALDLIGAIGGIPTGPIVDLGCGAGAVGPALRQCWPGRDLIGVDNAPEMLADSAKLGCYDQLQEADIASWAGQAALIYSNAALHWLGAHKVLFPKLMGMLVGGGVLAVQMPAQNGAPSHQTWVDLAVQMFGQSILPAQGPGALEAEDYREILQGAGDAKVWYNTYDQKLPAERGHPVRAYTQSTFARPILAVLDKGQKKQLIAAYEREINQHYPMAEDGSVVFPFRRLLMTLHL